MNAPAVLAALSQLDADKKSKAEEQETNRRLREERLAASKAKKTERDKAAEIAKWERMWRAVCVEAVVEAKHRLHRLAPSARKLSLRARSEKQRKRCFGDSRVGEH